MKALKRGKEEGQSKHSLVGQRLEEPVLKIFWEHLLDENVFGDDADLRTLYSLGLVKKEEKPYVKTYENDVLLMEYNIKGQLHH